MVGAYIHVDFHHIPLVVRRHVLFLQWRLIGVVANSKVTAWSKLMHVTSILERSRRELKESVSLIVQICETKIAEYQRRGTNYLT